MITEDFGFAVARWSRPEIHWLRRGSHPSAEARPHAASSLVTFELTTVGDPASVRHESSRIRVNVSNKLLCVVTGALVILVVLSSWLYHQPCPRDSGSNKLQAWTQSGWTVLTGGIVDFGA